MRVIDLTLPIAGDYPHRPISFTVTHTVPEHGYAITRIALDSHWGTHLDAPSHSIAGARTVDHLDLARCCGPAVCRDLTHRGQPGAEIDIPDLLPLADVIVPGARLLLRARASGIDDVELRDRDGGVPA